MNLLEAFCLPPLNEISRKELKYAKLSYNRLCHKTHQKKSILTNVLDIFVCLFDLDYNTKLKFIELEEFDDNVIYLPNVESLSFEEAIYKIYRQCFYKYIDKLYLLKDNDIDDDLFTISRLAKLNNNTKILDDLALNTYKSIVNNEGDYLINSSNIDGLLLNNKQRNEEIFKEVKKYADKKYLTPYQLTNVYTCFSSDIFNLLNANDKFLLVNLLNDYFAGDNLNYLKKELKSMSNYQVLLELGKHLLGGESISSKKRNLAVVDDLLSGIPIIYKNEIYKSNLCFNDLEKEIKNSKIR